MAKRAAKAEAPTYLSLADAAIEAVGAMSSVILRAGMADEYRWELDAASKALWAAVRQHKNWERTVMAGPSKPGQDLKLNVDLGPMPATCATCGNRALIVGMPTGPGLAICRYCSFE